MTKQEILGLVISRFGNQADIEKSDGHVVRCHIRRKKQNLVTGDRVTLEQKTDHYVVTDILPRESLLERSVPYEGLKPVAANIDQVVIVNAIRPIFSSRLLDRYLVACEKMQAQPLILFNKMDLADDNVLKEVQLRTEQYQDLGYNTLLTSTKELDKLESLKKWVRDKTTIFVGQSGVGKSSLLNALVPEAATLTAELSNNSELGMHTTTVSRLYHLPSGGNIIDSPGIRELSLTHLTPKDVTNGFVEIQKYSQQCKFRDCSHLKEPGCAVKNAVDSGKIRQERFENFLHILESLEVIRY
ncbi:MAG: small ribosomal subunit biogenesis GTPase RsgA [Pseudomonadota bacterium]